MKSENFLDKVSNYYSKKIIEFGISSRGVDWSDNASHWLRFKQLARILPKSDFTVLDFGCGFGALARYLKNNEYAGYKYIGHDISDEMMKHARMTFSDRNVSFIDNLDDLNCVDFAIANGVFNVKLDENYTIWESYVKETIGILNKLTDKGFAFNLLTSYSDPEFMEDKLYYANPSQYFDWCKINFSKNVALLHDYNLYEFTILVRK